VNAICGPPGAHKRAFGRWFAAAARRRNLAQATGRRAISSGGLHETFREADGSEPARHYFMSTGGRQAERKPLRCFPKARASSVSGEHRVYDPSLD
jgi:hypothetical protein